MTDVATAEQLWGRAHEHVKRGDFAQAVRDLAQCFQILQAHNDPRVYEVHRRWTEVHQMYLEDGAREQPAARAAAVEKTSVEAEAEAAANAGDLDRAIALYEEARRRQPQNELVKERVEELYQARARAQELTGRPAASGASSAAAQQAAAELAAQRVAAEESAQRAAAEQAAQRAAAQQAAAQQAAREAAAREAAAREAAAREAAAREAAAREAAAQQARHAAQQPAPAAKPVLAEDDWSDIDVVSTPPAQPAAKLPPVTPAPAQPKAVVAEDDWSDVAVDDPVPARAPAANNISPQTAPTMKPDDAPVGMQSLDVPLSIGESITSDDADELPITGAASQPPALRAVAARAPQGPQEQAAFLQELLARVQKNKRKVA
jgi:hypothetical protein